MRTITRPTWLPGAALAAVLLLSPLARAEDAAPAQESFATAQDAASALANATSSHDDASLAAVLGPQGRTLMQSGDPTADQQSELRFATAYDEKHTLVPQPDGKIVLQVGDDDWPLPIPLVQQDGRWRFDTAAGAQELIDRRIGRNELETIKTMLAYVDAQQDYFARAKAQTGTGFYAQHMVSAPGRKNGLYWPAEQGAPESPLGPLVDAALDEGYPGEIVHGQHIPYHGYQFRILTAQGPDAPEGTKSYISKGRMGGGFALIAWPASYKSSGIMSFIVNQDGVVFQKDLGPDTPEEAAHITRFNPDLSWTRIEPTEP